MNGPVLSETHLVTEGLVTQVAGERPGAAHVRPSGVDLEPVRSTENLITLDARVDVGQSRVL